jgi:hypothetical protein
MEKVPIPTLQAMGWDENIVGRLKKWIDFKFVWKIMNEKDGVSFLGLKIINIPLPPKIFINYFILMN